MTSSYDYNINSCGINTKSRSRTEIAWVAIKITHDFETKMNRIELAAHWEWTCTTLMGYEPWWVCVTWDENELTRHSIQSLWPEPNSPDPPIHSTTQLTFVTYEKVKDISPKFKNNSRIFLHKIQGQFPVLKGGRHPVIVSY